MLTVVHAVSSKAACSAPGGGPVAAPSPRAHLHSDSCNLLRGLGALPAALAHCDAAAALAAAAPAAEFRNASRALFHFNRGQVRPARRTRHCSYNSYK